MIEVIVNKRILGYFEAKGLFPQSQHGFWANRNTFTAVTTMHEKWLQIKENKSNSAVAFLDLSSAFDTLSKDIGPARLVSEFFTDPDFSPIFLRIPTIFRISKSSKFYCEFFTEFYLVASRHTLKQCKKVPNVQYDL